MSETCKQDQKPVSETKKNDPILSVVKIIDERLERMEKTIYRRLDEVSAEVDATCQMVGMSEDNLKGDFTEVLSTLQSIAFSGDGSTAANTGVELDAVIKATDTAANTILDQADQLTMFINACYEDGWANDIERKETMDHMRNAIEQIILACSFQDITSQRIRKTLESIENAEDRLNDSLSKLGIEKSDDTEKAKDEELKAVQQDVSSQADIDALFD